MSFALLLRLGGPLREAAAGMIEHFRRWALVLTKFVAVQLVVQALGIFGGLIVVRVLSKQDYALYTVANTTLPTLYLLANCGVTFAASAIGGRVWQDRRRLAQVVATAFRASRVTAAITTLPTALFLGWLLHRLGASVAETAILIVLVLTVAALQFSYSVLVVVPRLLGAFRFLQKVDVAAAGLRVLLLGAAALLLLDANITVLIGGLAALCQFLVVRSWVARNIVRSVPHDPEMLVEMRTVIKRQWLNELYYVSQGQISVFLLSVFGASSSVADYGALGRIAVIFSAVAAAMQSVILPRYARSQDPVRLRQLYIQIFAVNGLIAALPVLAAIAFPRPILWLLGAKYMGLSHELALVALSAGTASLAGAAGGLNAVRAWLIPGWLSVSLALAAQLILMPLIGVSTLSQVLLVSTGSNLFSTGLFVVSAVYFGRCFARAAARRAPEQGGAA